MANEVKLVFGSTTTAISLAAALANAAWTYSGLANCTMTAVDNSTVLYPFAKAVLDIPDTFAAAPTAGGAVYLWMTRNDIDGTSDTIPAPDVTALKNAELVAIFPISAYDVAQRLEKTFSLSGVKSADFFIENKCGQSLSYTSSPITVKVTPFSHMPT